MELTLTPMRCSDTHPLSKHIEVFVVPGSVTLQPGGNGFLNLILKMNIDGVKNPSQLFTHGSKVLKALVANAKQSSLVYGVYL